MVRSLQRTYKCLPPILFCKDVLGGTNRLSYLSGMGGGLRFRTKVGRRMGLNRAFPLLIGGKPGIERQNWTMSDFPF